MVEEWKIIAGVAISCATAFIGARAYVNSGTPVGNLYRRVRPYATASISREEHPLIEFSTNPYQEIGSSKKAVIFQGRSREGKTTLLATSIPWWRRHFFPWKGIYMNCAQGPSKDTVEKWETTQLLGSKASEGTEVARVLERHADGQFLRAALAAWGAPSFFHPKPAVVIVDQFEDLLRRFPDAGLKWASQLTNAHVRNLARVIFVVNSDDGAKSLLNLDEGDRFKVVKMEPATVEAAERAGFEGKRFELCGRNIGMYKLHTNVSLDRLHAVVEKTFRRWQIDHHVPFPAKADHSWYDDVPDDRLKSTFFHAFQLLISNITKEAGCKLTDEEVKQYVAIVQKACKILEPSALRNSTREEWAGFIAKAGDKCQSVQLAVLVSEVLSRRAPSSMCK